MLVHFELCSVSLVPLKKYVYVQCLDQRFIGIEMLRKDVFYSIIYTLWYFQDVNNQINDNSQL